MPEPFLGEIRIMAFPFAAQGWALCNGQLMPIAQNQALFALLGTRYGGDGMRTFALPNLQGRVALHPAGQFMVGSSGGEETHALSASQMPAHSHVATANANQADEVSPVGHFWGGGPMVYGAAANDMTASAEAIAAAGSGQPHNNLSPYLVLNFCIATQGLFPSRS